jgi:hypothetical protein
MQLPPVDLGLVKEFVAYLEDEMYILAAEVDVSPAEIVLALEKILEDHRKRLVHKEALYERRNVIATIKLPETKRASKRIKDDLSTL